MAAYSRPSGRRRACSVTLLLQSVTVRRAADGSILWSRVVAVLDFRPLLELHADGQEHGGFPLGVGHDRQSLEN